MEIRNEHTHRMDRQEGKDRWKGGEGGGDMVMVMRLTVEGTAKGGGEN